MNDTTASGMLAGAIGSRLHVQEKYSSHLDPAQRNYSRHGLVEAF